MIGRYKDQCGGVLMCMLGLYAVFQGNAYRFGTLRQMGPGFFPVALGTILLCIGAAIVATGRPRSAMDLPAEKRRPEWRGWFCIGLGIVAFVVLGRYGGLLPATFAIVFVSALGDRRNGVLAALVLSLALCVACVVIFWWALQLQFPLFRWG